MRYVSIFRSSQPDAGPPSQEEMAAMGALIERYMKDGALLVTEPLGAAEAGARVERVGGQVTVSALTERASGYAILQADTREQCVELCKEFLEVAGDGVCEIRQIVDMG